MSYTFNSGEDFAAELDEKDPLKEVRGRFYLKEDEIYMDGNSLGLMSKDAESSLLRVVEEWKNLGINGYMGGNPPWFYFSKEMSKQMAPLLGAEDDEITIHSSTTVNIHAMISTFFKPDGNKDKILMDTVTFPTDRYALDSMIKLIGLDPKKNLILIESEDGRTLDENKIVEKMTHDVALAFLPSVLYRSGQLLDMEHLTIEARKRDVIIGFDCCHSVGIVPHAFSEWGVDFAVWCNYKYLNIGPGGTAAMYINRRHFDKTPGLTGWFGYEQEKQFDLLNEFEPADNAGAWQMGSPHTLSMAPLEGSLKIFNEVGIQNIREKSLKITAYMMDLIDHELTPYGFSIGNPREDHRRGGHVALEHEEALRINAALKERGVIPDFRPPNVIRLAPVPLYISYKEVWRVVQIIKDIITTRAYENYENKRGLIA
jgi:kynureninase